MNRPYFSIFKTGFLAVMILVSSSGVVFAQEGRRGPPKDILESPAFRELNLSAEQKQQIQSIHQSGKEEFEKKRDVLKAARNQFHEKLESDANESQIRSSFKELQKAQNELGAARFEKALSIRKVLTPDQRKRFHEIKKEMHKQMFDESNPEEGLQGHPRGPRHGEDFPGHR